MEGSGTGPMVRIYALRKRWFRHEALESSNLPDTGLAGHVVIAGGGRLGFQVARVLKRLGLKFIIIELDHRRFEQAKNDGMTVVYGDAGQEVVLDAAGIKEASLLILTVPGLVVARSIVVHSKRLNNRIEIVARTSGPDYFDLFKDLGVSEVVLPEFEASLELTRQSLLRLRVLVTEVQRHTDAARQELYADLFDNDSDYNMLSQLRGAEQQFDLQWAGLVPESPMAHMSIGKSEILKKTSTSIVGVVREGRLWPNPDAEFVLMPEDLIGIIGGEEHRQAFCLMASSAGGNAQ